MNQTASFILSAYSFVFKYSVDKLLDVGYRSKSGNPIPSFDENMLITLCSDAKEIFEKESNVLHIDGDVIIVGDIHGNFHDLLRILNYFQENQKKVLFLGDFVDRGNFSLECITILFALKVIRPDLFYLIRGNHEFDYICSKYGFKDEILNYYNPKKPTESEDNKSILIMNLEDENNMLNNQSYHEYLADHTDMNCYAYSEILYNSFVSTFAYLPVAAIVNDTTFCIHGGLSPNLDSVDDLVNHINRPIVGFDENALLCDVVWSDPTSCFHSMFRENLRGSGYMFNQVAVNFFLSKNSLKRMVRAHECISNGVQSIFNDMCITVFSASNYCNKGNRSGILEIFSKDDRLEIKHFPPVDHLQKSDTVYYKVQNQNQTERLPFSLLYPFLNVNSPIKLSTNMKLKKGKTRNSYNSINYSKQTPLVKPSFTTKPRKSLVLHQSPSVANFQPSSSTAQKGKDHRRLVVSQSMPNFF